jgi:hypothetical protein
MFAHAHAVPDALSVLPPVPIEERYDFSRVYNSWHGSPEWENSRIPIIVARAGETGTGIRPFANTVVGDRPSQLDITRPVLRLLEGVR